MSDQGDISKILIVEDDPEIIECYTEFLNASYGIAITGSGYDAIEILKSGEKDLVILDYNLPDVSGLDVLKEIKRMKASIPVLFVTGQGNEDVAVRAFRYGARDYIKKPFSFEELTEKIKFCISLRMAISENRRESLFYEEEAENVINQTAIAPYNNYKIQKALKLIDENYMTKMNLEIAASKACMSKFHFSRIFKKATGVNFQKYINNRRVEKAKELLRSTDLTVTEIAMEVGYGDITSFERIFKNCARITPSAYKTFQKDFFRCPSCTIKRDGVGHVL